MASDIARNFDPLIESVSDETRIDRLTAGQCECLRLVQRLQTSKQIAAMLSISRHTVDQRLSAACRLLGANSRAEAALLLAKYEKKGAPFPLIPIVEKAAQPAAFRPALPQLAPDEWSDGFGGGEDYGLIDNEQRTSHAELPAEDRFVPEREGMRNGLNIKRNFILGLAICTAIIVMFGALIAAIDILGKLL